MRAAYYPCALQTPVKESVHAGVMWKCILSHTFQDCFYRLNAYCSKPKQTSPLPNVPVCHSWCPARLAAELSLAGLEKAKNGQNFCMGNLTFSISACQTSRSKAVPKEPRWGQAILCPQLRLLLPQQRRRSFLRLLLSKHGARFYFFLKHFRNDLIHTKRAFSLFSSQWLYWRLPTSPIKPRFSTFQNRERASEEATIQVVQWSHYFILYLAPYSCKIT